MKTSSSGESSLRPSQEAAIDAIIRSQQLCESLANRYTADLLEFDDRNETRMAGQFRRGVLAAIQDEDYQRAVVRLDDFAADFLHDDPLMRIHFGGLTTMLRPILVVLANAQQNGLDAVG